MCVAAKKYCGYAKSWISNFKRTGRGSDEMLMALSYAVPLAQREINQRRAEMTYTGSECARHGLTERYISSNQCVECAKYFLGGEMIHLSANDLECLQQRGRVTIWQPAAAHFSVGELVPTSAGPLRVAFVPRWSSTPPSFGA